MLLLLSLCGERDVPLSLELALDLAVEGLLVRFDGQEHVGPLLSSRLVSSSLRVARSLDSPVS